MRCWVRRRFPGEKDNDRGGTSSGYALELRQRFTMMQNRYDLVAVGDTGEYTLRTPNRSASP
jgi:hypothetical protein